MSIYYFRKIESLENQAIAPKINEKNRDKKWGLLGVEIYPLAPRP